MLATPTSAIPGEYTVIAASSIRSEASDSCMVQVVKIDIELPDRKGNRQRLGV